MNSSGIVDGKVLFVELQILFGVIGSLGSGGFMWFQPSISFQQSLSSA